MIQVSHFCCYKAKIIEQLCGRTYFDYQWTILEMRLDCSLKCDNWIGIHFKLYSIWENPFNCIYALKSGAKRMEAKQFENTNDRNLIFDFKLFIAITIAKTASIAQLFKWFYYEIVGRYPWLNLHFTFNVWNTYMHSAHTYHKNNESTKG